MTERFKSWILLFAFSYLIWGGISYVFLRTAYDDFVVRQEINDKVGTEDCPMLDQYRNCWTKQEWADHLSGKDKFGEPVKFEWKQMCKNRMCGINNVLHCDCYD